LQWLPLKRNNYLRLGFNEDGAESQLGFRRKK
jgi:hypothetical protein